MNKAFLYIIFFFLCKSIQLKSQNLVPNPSFEEFWYCPSGLSNLAYPTSMCVPVDPPSPKNWFDPNCASSDYYNICSTDPLQTGVPSNFCGFQNPKTGNAYCGLNFCGSPCGGYGEYIAVKLLEPLEPNKEYCISFWISRADSFCLVTNNFGLNFYSDSTFTYDTKYYLDPSVLFTDLIYEEVNWVELKTNYIANGTESFFVIGNFDSTEVSSDTLCDNSAWNVWSYYYVDDVSVIPVENCDTTILVIPNVFTPNGDTQNDLWQVSSVSDLDVIIYNRWGTVVFENKSKNISWGGDLNSVGVYYYILKKNNTVYKGFIQLFR